MNRAIAWKTRANSSHKKREGAVLKLHLPLYLELLSSQPAVLTGKTLTTFSCCKNTLSDI